MSDQDERYCTNCPYFKDVKSAGERWYGAKCNKDGHTTSPSMYAIISLFEDCPYKSESEGKE